MFKNKELKRFIWILIIAVTVLIPKDPTIPIAASVVAIGALIYKIFKAIKETENENKKMAIVEILVLAIVLIISLILSIVRYPNFNNTGYISEVGLGDSTITSIVFLTLVILLTGLVYVMNKSNKNSEGSKEFKIGIILLVMITAICALYGYYTGSKTIVAKDNNSIAVNYLVNEEAE